MNKLRKRYFLLIALAIVPFYRLFHFDDYCFGDKDLLLIAGLTIIFVIAFIVVVFNNLYGISLRKELFNFRPIIIAGVFTLSLLFGLKFHENSLFKNEVQVFKTQKKDGKFYEIKLFEDTTFEFRTVFSNYNCVKKGIYFYKKDSLFLNRTHKSKNEDYLDSLYILNRTTN
ncbi:MAG: hypothetical protein ACJA1B_002280, partial [Polaribacter sp.]